jgi:hypothetical protein
MAKKPIYGYARNRYGNILERDSYNEDLHNEIYQAEEMQRNYDYSLYDSEDDNNY